jgi:hypothetical protein
MARGSYLQKNSTMRSAQELVSENQAPRSTMNPIARKLNPWESLVGAAYCAPSRPGVRNPASGDQSRLILVRFPATG